MNRYDKDTIIEKAIELGNLLASSDTLNELREAEIAFLNDKEAQLIVNDIKKLEKSGNTNKLSNLKQKLFKLDSYKRLLEAQKTSKKLIDEIHGILNYYINETSGSCNSKCTNCSKHCINKSCSDC